jgi:antitoxin PrlF
MDSYLESTEKELTATLSEKGQITIPKPLRDSLGLRTGTVLRFKERAGTLVARKVVDEDPFASVWGILKLPDGMSVDEYMDEIRGPVDLP